MGRLFWGYFTPATSWLPAGAKEASWHPQGGPKRALEAPKWLQNDPQKGSKLVQIGRRVAPNRPQIQIRRKSNAKFEKLDFEQPSMVFRCFPLAT